jgi:hypothetical protein
MGSRVLRSLNPSEPLSELAAHYAHQSQTTTATFTGFFEVVVGCLIWKSKAKRRLIRRASGAVVRMASRGRGDPDGSEGTSCVTGNSV